MDDSILIKMAKWINILNEFPNKTHIKHLKTISFNEKKKKIKPNNQTEKYSTYSDSDRFHTHFFSLK